MADVAIIASETKSVPQDYTIPGAQEILPKAVSASMDGSAAASAWFPCLQVLDPFGHVMFSAVAGSSRAAGASADVSWFPGLGGSSNTTLIAGQIVQTYWGNPAAADFVWAVGGTVATGYPPNNTFTKMFDDTYLQLMFEGDFTAGVNPDNISLGIWLNNQNRLNVACGTVGAGSFSSVQGASNRGIPGDPVAFPAGVYTVEMKVSSFLGQATTFRCKSATTVSIVELGPV